MCYNQHTQQWELREVEVAFEHIYFGDIVTLTIQHKDGSAETIEATGNHPFWVVAGEGLSDRPAVGKLPADEPAATSTGRWTEARHLRLGDHFLTRTGKSATVAGLTIRIERVKVYNLQVAELHLYAVGEHGVLVHNSGRTTVIGRGRDLDRYFKGIRGWYRRTILRQERMSWPEKIVDGRPDHWHNLHNNLSLLRGRVRRGDRFKDISPGQSGPFLDLEREWLRMLNIPIR